MHPMGAPDRADRRLGEAEVAHFSLAHELGHRADSVLDRSARIDAMLIVEVDGVDAEPLERCIARLAHVLRTAVDSPECAVVGIADVAELGGDDDAITLSL